MPISKTVLTIIIAIIVIAAVGGGIAYYFYSQAKPKKIIVYAIGKGVHPYWDVVAAGVERAEQEIEQKFGVDIDAFSGHLHARKRHFNCHK